MLGLVIALIYWGWGILMGTANPSVSILEAASFLKSWYTFWAWAMGILYALISFGVIGAGTIAGASKKGFLGSLVGLTASSGVMLIVGAQLLIKYGLMIGGAMLIQNSGTPDMALAHFDMTQLIGGFLMIIVGSLMGRSSSKKEN